MKRIISLISLTLLTTVMSTASFAGLYQWNKDNTKIHGDIVSSKEAAYLMGHNMIKEYRDMSSDQLTSELIHAYHRTDRESVSITNTKVVVDEFLQSNGTIAYQPVLNVSYKYRIQQRNGR
ncbi:DUF3316 domain-containing protein [Vibrio sinensis]|uniref:DUF3316 domain-containing protein n=1 Tax=Vibrio sinensis TaxID=2302434 RepID=A0A3A6QSK6_9VIBR|nr:DUF3316 domain-containing protein [Vibrio sinensis]RJX74298.1 DUF3316 domain-containing protein [Vibrio sinensis]